jgi:hypothetical protein
MYVGNSGLITDVVSYGRLIDWTFSIAVGDAAT